MKKELILDYENTHCTSIAAHPFEGIGKPEPLKHILSGKWPRRITKEHRIVYAVTDDRVIVLQLRFHY